MGLLDGGIAAEFASAFSGVYLFGTLHKITRTELAGGDWSTSTGNTEIRGQVDQATEAMREENGFTEKDSALIILSQGVGEPTAEDEITLGGIRWAVMSVRSDPANSHWVIRGRPN